MFKPALKVFWDKKKNRAVLCQIERIAGKDFWFHPLGKDCFRSLIGIMGTSVKKMKKLNSSGVQKSICTIN